MPQPSLQSTPITSRPFLLDGEWIDSADRLTVISPWTAQPVTTVPNAGAEHARIAADAAKKVAPVLREMSYAQRANALQSIAQGIAHRASEIAAAICTEVAKPMWLSQAEVQRAVLVFRIAAEEALRPPGSVVYPGREPHGAGLVGRIQYFPIGPILGITPFNFPLNLIAHKVAPALAAGCPIVIKPPPQGPSAALILGEIVLESGFPQAALQVLTGGLETGQALCAQEAFRALSFTGSASAGWSIKKNALPRQKVVLELGGNAAVIVDESADLEAAAKAVSIAGYIFAGQICISTQRVFVHKNVYDYFERRLAEKILLEVPVSAKASDEKAFVGPLIDTAAADRVESWIERALKNGARPLIQGKRLSERLISPWLLENVPVNEPLYCEEVFGPVVVMQKVESLEEGIALTNASRYGLQASVFTQSLRHAEIAYRDIDAGAVLINIPTTFRLDSAPYGGTKDSGFGREGVSEVIREFTEPKLGIAKA